MATGEGNPLGTYTNYVTDQLYPSGSYNDDLAYAAAWMYRVTGSISFWTEAESWWSKARDDGNLCAFSTLLNTIFMFSQVSARKGHTARYFKKLTMHLHHIYS